MVERCDGSPVRLTDFFPERTVGAQRALNETREIICAGMKIGRRELLDYGADVIKIIRDGSITQYSWQKKTDSSIVAADMFFFGKCQLPRGIMQQVGFRTEMEDLQEDYEIKSCFYYTRNEETGEDILRQRFRLNNLTDGPLGVTAMAINRTVVGDKEVTAGLMLLHRCLWVAVINNDFFLAVEGNEETCMIESFSVLERVSVQELHKKGIGVNIEDSPDKTKLSISMTRCGFMGGYGMKIEMGKVLRPDYQEVMIASLSAEKAQHLTENKAFLRIASSFSAS